MVYCSGHDTATYASMFSSVSNPLLKVISLALPADVFLLNFDFPSILHLIFSIDYLHLFTLLSIIFSSTTGWSFPSLQRSLNSPHRFLLCLSSYPSSLSFICFLSLCFALLLSLPLSILPSQAEVTPLTFPQHGCQTQFQHLSRFPLPHPNRPSFLCPHPSLCPHFLGLKQKQKLAPELAEVIGIKLQ